MAQRTSVQALVDAAVAATGADRGWLLRLEDDHLVVVAAAGGERPGDLVGRRRELIGTTGYVVSANSPAALQIRSNDQNHLGAGGVDGVPSSLLAAPCSGDEDVDGVLELVDSANGSFGFDEVEIVGLLSEIAGAMLEEESGTSEGPPSPAALSGDLDALAASDPRRYAAVATVIESLLGR